VSVVLAACLWNVERHVAIVALVLGVVLPYIAVVIANAGRENAPSLPTTFVTVPTPPMIMPPRADDGADGGAARSGPRQDAMSDPSQGAAGGSRDRP
jgi:hypothetical protein